jgi:hypothetical protein
MKPQGPIFAGVVLLLGLLCASQAPAQLPWRWFGAKTPDKTAKPAFDPRRAAEIEVEIAWYADPITFPYYLEARVNAAQQLEVRGYVPNKTVREHALRTAQVYSSLPVLDSLKEHASLLVRPTPMSPQQLQSSVQSSLKVALPRQYAQLKIECAGDGKVFVSGPVSSYEEKIAVSHSLRRLYGCTSVQNLTSVPGELARAATPSPSQKTVQAALPPENKSKSWFPWSTAKTVTRDEPPLLDPKPEVKLAQNGPPIRPNEPQKNPMPEVKGPPALAQNPSKNNYPEIPLVILPVGVVKEKNTPPESKQPPEPNKVDLPAPRSPEPMKIELPTPPSAPIAKLTPEELRKRIQAACPKITKVDVTFKSATDVKIILSVRSDDDVNSSTERLFAMPELQNYRPDLQFNIGTP